MEKFCNGRNIFVAGSSWEADEAVFLPLVNRKDPGMKFVIAPHDPTPQRIRSIASQVEEPCLCYSELTDDNASTAEVLLIDSVGLLALLYRYATVAFIGGGFGGGIHNIQEPVTFGVPVFSGRISENSRRLSTWSDWAPLSACDPQRICHDGWRKLLVTNRNTIACRLFAGPTWRITGSDREDH